MPAAYLLSWPTAVWCSVGVRRALVLSPGLQSHTQTHDMAVTHLSMMAISESVGVSWFVPKPVVVNMQASGCDTLERWRRYLSSLPLIPLSVFATNLSEVFNEKHICVSSDPGYDHYLSLCMTVWDATVAACKLPDEHQGRISVLLLARFIHVILCLSPCFSLPNHITWTFLSLHPYSP